MTRLHCDAAQIMANDGGSTPHLSVRTLPLSDNVLTRLGLDVTTAQTPPAARAQSLLRLVADCEDVTAWLHEGYGLVGMGQCLRLSARGQQRIEQLRAAWRAVVYASWWSDPLVRPGTGPVALGTIAFAASSDVDSVLVVPSVLIGCDEQGAWLTTAVIDGEIHPHPESLIDGLAAQAAAQATPETAGSARTAPGEHTTPTYLACVRRVCERMAAGEVDKVVLARDLLVFPEQSTELATVLQRLAGDYPSCWTFAVEGMVGASPELLVRLHHRRLHSRVLAGTARRHATGDAERAAEAATLRAWLESSPKNNREHALARASALDALEPLCSVLECPPRFVLDLPNVLHLASDVRGVVAGDTGALALVRALHPTAAVGGTPREVALGIIEAEEAMDRGRYAGPVGWVDWHGEGEWCIALRSGQFTAARADADHPVRIFGGGGIMVDSDPQDELAETQAKMRPMLSALGAASAPTDSWPSTCSSAPAQPNARGVGVTSELPTPQA